MKLVTDILKAFTDAYIKKPIAIGARNLNKPVVRFLEGYTVNKKEKAPIKIQAGSNQIIKVITARGTPPLLKPISVSTCVLDAPGNIWQKELYSINSSSVTYSLFCTKFFNIMPRWPCGPPKAVTLYKSTAFKKGICLIRVNGKNKTTLFKSGLSYDR
jgi:hypothetical protein